MAEPHRPPGGRSAPGSPGFSGTGLPAHLGIVGLGLIGGSLAKGVRRARPDAWIVGVDPDAGTRALARDEFTCDEVSPALDGRLQRCELVVLAAPVPEIARLLGEIRPFVAAGAVITDVGGAKAKICAAADAAGLTNFVGSHPMMGTEHSGYSAARADLLHGGAVAVCPARRTRAELCDRVEAFWRALGNRTARCTPEDHDRAVALVSHLPYFAATALCRVAAGRWDGLAELLASTGFLGTTRLAADGTVGEAALANGALPDMAVTLAQELASLARQLREDPKAARTALESARAFRRAIGKPLP